MFCGHRYSHISMEEVTDEFLVETLHDFVREPNDEEKRYKARAFVNCEVLANELFSPGMDYRKTVEYLSETVPGIWLLRESSVNIGQDSRMLVVARRFDKGVLQTRLICVRGVGVFMLPSSEVPLILSHDELARKNFKFFVCVMDAIEEFMTVGSPSLLWCNLIVATIHTQEQKA